MYRLIIECIERLFDTLFVIFCRLLYGWPETRQLAIDTFEANKQSLMNMSVVAVAKALHLDTDSK